MAEPQRARTGLALRDPIAWHDLVQVAETAEQTGCEAIFLPEIMGREAFATLSGLVCSTERLLLGTGVAALPSRTLQVTAMAAATVQERSGGRFVLGLGSGPPVPGSLGRLRDAVLALREALAGRPAAAGGESFQLALVPETPPPIWIAALGDRMIRLAGEVADGVLLNWCTPQRVARARELMADGAARAGRDPAGVTVAAYVRACIGHEDGAALEALGQATLVYAGMPHYRHQLDLMGLGELAASPDRSEQLVRALCLVGDPGPARRRLQEYRDAGADLPVVYPVPVLEPVSSIMGTIMALAPSTELEP